MRQLTVAVAMASDLLAAGVAAMLAACKGHSAVVRRVGDDVEAIVAAHPSVVFADPVSLGREAVVELRGDARFKGRLVAVTVGALPPEVRRLWDDEVTLYDGSDRYERIMAAASVAAQPDTQAELSPRECDVVLGIVKGLSNKEIAAELCVSVHTVMTHRRNISRKLHIHSPAALTIYAIVKGLVNVDEIRNVLNQ